MGQCLVVTRWPQGHVRQSRDVQTWMSCSGRWHQQAAPRFWTLLKGYRQTATRSDRSQGPVFEEPYKALAMFNQQQRILGGAGNGEDGQGPQKPTGLPCPLGTQPTDRDGFTMELM